MQQMILGWFAGRWLEVRDPVQARLLTDPTSRALLEPFVGSEKSVTQAAAEIGCSVQRLLYRIRQFQEAGLLEEVRQEPRAGRPIRVYRAVADGFHIPFALTPFADMEALIAKQHAPTDRLRNRASARLALEGSSGGRRIYRDAASGELHSESDTPAPDNLTERMRGQAGNDVTLEVYLKPEAARAFALELRDLCARFQDATLPGMQGQRFLVHLGLLPLIPGDGD